MDYNGLKNINWKVIIMGFKKFLGVFLKVTAVLAIFAGIFYAVKKFFEDDMDDDFFDDFEDDFEDDDEDEESAREYVDLNVAADTEEPKEATTEA